MPTLGAKLVCDYAQISFLRLGEIQVDDFRALLRDAYIYKLQQTKDGQEYLQKCWTLEQSKPDRGKLREHFGGGNR